MLVRMNNGVRRSRLPLCLAAITSRWRERCGQLSPGEREKVSRDRSQEDPSWLLQDQLDDMSIDCG